jgi:hypothetical protein
MRSLFAMLLLLAACRTAPLDFDGGVPGSDLAAGAVDGGRRDMANAGNRDLAGIPTSCCGKQGNPGNELGVGRFCQSTLDCQSVQAKICSSTFGSPLTFCTMACKMGGPADQCGSGAQCECSGNGQCACIPGECVQPPPGC